MQFCNLSSIGVLEIASHHVPENRSLCTMYASLDVVGPPITRTPFLVISLLSQNGAIYWCLFYNSMSFLSSEFFSQFNYLQNFPQPSAPQVRFTSCFVPPSTTLLHRIITHCLALIVSVFLDHPVLTWLSVPIIILLTCFPHRCVVFNNKENMEFDSLYWVEEKLS